jgi:hypothetical protein
VSKTYRTLAFVVATCISLDWCGLLSLLEPYLILLRRLPAGLRSLIEEVGCQTCEQLSLGERVFWGSDFSWRESRNNYSTLRLLVQPITEALEGRRTIDELVIVKVYTPGVEQVCGE